MHLPRTVLTIALAASTATALPGWRSKTNKDEVKCESGTCTHGGNYQKGQGQVKEFYQQRQHEPRSERGGGGTRGPWHDDETTGNDRVVGKDHGPYDNGLRVVGDDHGPYDNGLRVVGKDHGPYDNNARVVGNDHGPYDNGLFTKGGDDFYQGGGNGDRKGGSKLGEVNPDNKWYQGGDRKGGSPVLTPRNFHNFGPKIRYEKEEGKTPYQIEYTKGGQGSGHVLPRHVETNDKENDPKLISYVKGGVVSPRNYHKMGKQNYETGNGQQEASVVEPRNYHKMGKQHFETGNGQQEASVVEPRNYHKMGKQHFETGNGQQEASVVEPRYFHNMGKIHYETGNGQQEASVVEPRNFHNMGKIHYETGNDEQKEAVTGNGRQHFWTRHIEGPTTGDDFAQTKPTEGGDEFVAGRRPTKTDNFVNTKNQGGDEFVAGRRPTKTDNFVNTKNQGGDKFVNGGRRSNPDDFAQVKGGDDFYTGGRTKGDDFAQVKAKGGDDFYTGNRIKGGDEIDYSRGQRGGSTQNEISYQPKQPRDVKTNGGEWKESSSNGCFEIYGKGPKGENTFLKCL